MFVAFNPSSMSKVLVRATNTLDMEDGLKAANISR